MEAALKACVEKAIREFGIENFKRTSLFLSNERAQQDLKKAA
jgi:hypothetical protein